MGGLNEFTESLNARDEATTLDVFRLDVCEHAPGPSSHLLLFCKLACLQDFRERDCIHGSHRQPYYDVGGPSLNDRQRVDHAELHHCIETTGREIDGPHDLALSADSLAALELLGLSADAFGNRRLIAVQVRLHVTGKDRRDNGA